MEKKNNECLFCKSKKCYERVFTSDMIYDQIACKKHINELHKHSDLVMPGVVKTFISGTSLKCRGEKVISLK